MKYSRRTYAIALLFGFGILIVYLTYTLWSVERARPNVDSAISVGKTPANYICVSRDGETVLGATLGGQVGLWRLGDGARISDWQAKGSVRGVHTAESGWVVVHGQGDTRLSFLNSRLEATVAEVQFCDVTPSTVAFSAGATVVAVAARNSRNVWIGHIGQGHNVAISQIELRSPAQFIGLSDYGTFLVVLTDDNRLVSWNVGKQEMASEFRIDKTVRDFAVSGNKQLVVAMITDEGECWLADMSSAKIVYQKWCHFRRSLEIAISKDNRRFALGGMDGDVNVYDINSGQLIGAIAGHGLPVYDLVFSSDARRVFVSTVKRVSLQGVIWIQSLPPDDASPIPESM